jgi:uncharacterized membrane protein
MRSANLDGNGAISWVGFLAGASLGAACMYLVDPTNGARRRAVVREVAGAIAKVAEPAHPARHGSIEKTIHINAPVDRVFDFWTNRDNLPRYITNVRRVNAAHVNGHYHWRIAAQGHVPIEFDVAVTRLEPNRIVAWKTLEGSSVAHAGVIQFESASDGGTYVHIQFFYNSPAGAVGHAIARLLGDNPAARIDEDLARMKFLMEG